MAERLLTVPVHPLVSDSEIAAIRRLLSDAKAGRAVAVEFFFWGSVVFVFYAYFGYPLALYVIARLFGKPVRRSAITPTVSLIIAARNEALRIRSKIENTLALDYPRDLLEIIVASDCSDDGTRRHRRGVREPGGETGGGAGAARQGVRAVARDRGVIG